jgi:HEPN domain-containing protein
MGDIRGLLARALRDIKLARRFRQRKEYATTTMLYRKAIDKVLRALFIGKRNKAPPVGASATYIATSIRMPEELMAEIMSLREDEDRMAEGWNGMRQWRTGCMARPEWEVVQIDELATKLMDSAMGYAKA